MRASASCGVIKAFMVEKESAAGASWQKAESVSVLRDTVLGRLATFLQLSCGKIVQVRTGVFLKRAMVQDTRGRGITDLRISLTDRCNLRCTYCMPKEVFGPDYVFLKKQEWLRFSELDAVVAAFVRLGVRKLRLTGGEPLLRPGLLKYIEGLRRFEPIEDVALTTNGMRLAEKVGDLKAAGLKRVTVSLDALDADLCGRMNGRGIGPKVVLAGIDAALKAGLGVKVNMVVERG